MDRRDFLRVSAATLVGLAAAGVRVPGAGESAAPGVRFGLITDPHYADADTKGTRFYRESIDKVREAVARLRAERLSFLCELGDLKDMAAGESDSRTGAHLAAIEAEIRRFGGPTCHVLGNHDMDNLSKAQFLDGITNTGLAPPRQSPRERTRPVWHHARACFDECGVSLGLPIARCAVGKFRYEWREKLAACGATLAISALSVTSVVALHVRTTPLRHA